MSVVDYERAWAEFKAELVKKNSFGQRELLITMAKIEVENRLPDSERGFDPSPQHRPAVGALREVRRHG